MEITTYSDKYKEQTIALIFDILENELGQHSRSGRPDLQQISEEYQKNKGNFWLALEKGKVIGTIALSDCADGIGYMARMYVNKEYRKMGVASKLLATLISFAKANGYKEIFLATWKEAIAANAFYIKNGFSRIDVLPARLLPRTHGDDRFYQFKL